MANNKFTIHSTLFLDQEQMSEIRRYINNFYIGKELIPMKEKVSKELKEIHYRINAGRSIMIGIEIDEKGVWKINKITCEGIKYKLIKE